MRNNRWKYQHRSISKKVDALRDCLWPLIVNDHHGRLLCKWSSMKINNVFHVNWSTMDIRLVMSFITWEKRMSQSKCQSVFIKSLRLRHGCGYQLCWINKTISIKKRISRRKTRRNHKFFVHSTSTWTCSRLVSKEFLEWLITRIIDEIRRQTSNDSLFRFVRLMRITEHHQHFLLLSCLISLLLHHSIFYPIKWKSNAISNR